MEPDLGARHGAPREYSRLTPGSRAGASSGAGPERTVSGGTKEAAMPTSNPMQLGMVGLGRMGAGIVRRLRRDGHTCVVFDVNPDAVTALEKDGVTGSTSMADFVAKLSAPRAVWVM